MSNARRTTIAAIRESLRTGRRECDDPTCPGWAVFESGRGLEIQRCDTCCPDVLGDDQVARLPEARKALQAAKDFAKKRTTAARRAGEKDPIEIAIADAERHGCQSDDPDHEVGDLQQLVRLLARHLGPRKIKAAMAEWAPWDGPEDDGWGPAIDHDRPREGA